VKRGEGEIELTVKVQLTPRQIAEAFCSLYDEGQAQFFIECAAIAKGWDRNGVTTGGDSQWLAAGGHLRTCKCSTPEAREMIASISYAANRDEPA